MAIESSPSDFNTGFSGGNIDSVLAGFKDENICGEGATCKVYRMWIDGFQVAVKRLHPELRTDPTCVSAYRKEYSIGRNLKHDSLPTYRDFYETIGEVYIVMEYVAGISLEKFVETQDGKRYFDSVENVRRFLGELFDVVAYLHRSGVVHCDLKPANIILRNIDRRVILLDLDKSYSDTLDRTSGGTAFYSDPVSDGRKPTAQKDFAAIGRILDYIANNVPGFPAYKFRRIRKRCLSTTVNEYALNDLLNRKSDGKIWMAVWINLIVVIGAIFTIITIWATADKDHRDDSYILSPELNQDSTMTGNPVKPVPSIEDTVLSPASHPHPAAPKSDHSKPRESISELLIDIDAPMAEFSSKLEASYKELITGNARSRLSDILSELVELHSQAFYKILNDAKLRYPDIPGIDVEIEVARRYENSRAGKLYVEFNTVVSDSLRKWDRESK